MAIYLEVELNDPDLENLLSYLNKQTHLNVPSKEMLLSNALEWMKRCDRFAYQGKTPRVILSLGDNREPFGVPQELPSQCDLSPSVALKG